MMSPDKKMMLEKMISGEMSSNSSPMTKPMPGDSKDSMLQAKLAALEDILMQIQEELGGRVKNDMDEMKKVSVVAPDTESLKEGLEMAEEVVPEIEGEEMKEESEGKEIPAEAPEMEEDEEEDDGQYGLFGKRK